MMTGVRAGNLHQGDLQRLPIQLPRRKCARCLLSRNRSSSWAVRTVTGPSPGDTVVIEVLPKAKWKAPSTKIIEGEDSEQK